MFLHYVFINTAINVYDEYIGLPISDLELLVVYVSITGIMLFLILYIHVKHHKRVTTKNSR